MTCVGKVYKDKRWAKRFAPGHSLKKVKGGYKVLKKR